MDGKTHGGVIVCGLNGAGKSTVGREAAKLLGFHFMDVEDYYFPDDPKKAADAPDKCPSPRLPFSSPRSFGEVCERLSADAEKYGDFVLASVRGGFGEKLVSLYRLAVLIEVPSQVRAERIRRRAYLRFGDRVRPGGDMYESEEAFFAFAAARRENYAEEWVLTLSCPVLHVNGTLPAAENAAAIAAAYGAEVFGAH